MLTLKYAKRQIILWEKSIVIRYAKNASLIWKENMSKTIEFITTIHQGVIVIPQEYQGKLEEAQEVQVIFKTKTTSPHPINQLKGKVTAFKNINSVAWQQQMRKEWDETRLSD